jgi:hypothetical protein
MRPGRQTLRFDGAICSVGTTGGVRVVLGLWPSSPFGLLVDAMVELADGHRVLIAPTADTAEFIAATYHFDEVRQEDTRLAIAGGRWSATSPSLSVAVDVGPRTAVGWLLSTVPRPLARNRLWCRAIDPVARRVRRGVRTYGTAGGGRQEYYCALDEHGLVSATVSWEGRSAGDLRPVDPPVRFGFGSSPRVPSLVRVTTLIDL